MALGEWRALGVPGVRISLKRSAPSAYRQASDEVLARSSSVASSARGLSADRNRPMEKATAAGIDRERVMPAMATAKALPRSTLICRTNNLDGTQSRLSCVGLRGGPWDGGEFTCPERNRTLLG